MGINNALTKAGFGTCFSINDDSAAAMTKICSSVAFSYFPSWSPGAQPHSLSFSFLLYTHTMRLSLCFIVLAFFGLLVLGQEAEQQEEQQQTEERPSEGQQVEQQPAETQQTEEQQPNGGQRGGLKACKPTDLFPGPNAILIAPELTVEFDAESKAIRNVSFQAAPGWAPDSLSSCTVGEGRSVPPPGKKVS